MKTKNYFGGTPDNMGTVRSLPYESFPDLVDNLFRIPVQLAVTKAELMAMDKAAASEAKRTDYIVPANFRGDPSPRRTESAVGCALVILDIDNPAEALRVLEQKPETLLSGLAAVVYHTARSTPEAPRLRVVVSSTMVPVAEYPQAVTRVAQMLGIAEPSRESMVPVQPMFLPACFSDDTADPVVYSNPAGHQLPHVSTANSPLDPDKSADDNDDEVVGGLEHLRHPVDHITPDDVVSALEVMDPDCPMQQWVEVGMGLKHQFGEAGWALWDAWSAKSKGGKYAGEVKTRKRWDSFAANPANRTPVTLRTVLHIAEQAGWNNRQASDKVYGRLSDWITSSSRTTEELLDHGANKIADSAVLLAPLKQAALIGTLSKVVKSRGIAGISITSLTKTVNERIDSANKAQQPSGPPPWATNIIYVTASRMFYRYLDDRKMHREVIDLIYRSPDPTLQPREYLIHKVKIGIVENLRYDPSSSNHIITYKGLPYCNTYQRTYPTADPSQLREVEDYLIPHATNLFGPQYYKTMVNFTAYMAQYPGKKIRWAPLIQSTLGAGKGLWAKVNSVALGYTNVQHLAASHALEANYNSWATGFQLSVFDEAHDVGQNAYKVQNKLKPHISDDLVSIRTLYEPVQMVPNNMNFILFTNYHNALAVHQNDRRYFVVYSPLQRKEHVIALGGDAYFQHGYDLLRTHAGGIRAFFESWKITSDFNPEGCAPETPFLHELAKATASPLAAAVQDVIDDQPHALLRGDLISLSVLRGCLPTDRLPAFSDQGLAAILREKNFVCMGRHLIDNVRHSLWVRDFAGDPVQEAAVRLSVL